jgi:ribosome-associated protein
MPASPASPAEPASGTTLYNRPSKTQLKKEMHALQSLGQALADLSADQLASMPIEERLRDAIDMLRRTRSHEGRRRQLQFVGKLMRLADAEPIREALAALELGSAEDTLRLHRIEAWRKDLVASDDAITRWVAAHPDTDVKRLRDLARAARADALTPAEERHGRAWRELFRFLKPHVDAGQAA